MAAGRGSKCVAWSILTQVPQAQPWRQAGREEAALEQAGREERGSMLAEGLTSVSGL